MDLQTLNDYPLKLKPDELDYELQIRGIFNLGNPRLKTSTLRDFLKKESSGEISAPKIIMITNTQSEINICLDIYDDITKASKQASRDNNILEYDTCFHRLRHVMSRLERIVPSTPDDEDRVYELLDCVYDSIHQISILLSAPQNKKASTTNQKSQISNSTSQSNSITPINIFGSNMSVNRMNQ